MTTVHFVKVEGLSNDFVLVDLREGAPPAFRLAGMPGATQAWIARLAQEAVLLCDRRRGVGGDGLLLLTDSQDADARMIVINADGSRPEMCGNGLRCAAQALRPRGGTVLVETDSGLLRCEVSTSGDDGGSQTQDGAFAGTPASNQGAVEVLVSMGTASNHGQATTQAAPGRSFHHVSMGNPHAIHFVGDGEAPEDLARTLGPLIENAPEYPARTNVEFARLEHPQRITLWVWERGCGITAACGTGACATAAAAVGQALAPADQPIEVRLPGGVLWVTVPSAAGGCVMMRGPARQVFRGAYTL